MSYFRFAVVPQPATGLLSDGDVIHIAAASVLTNFLTKGRRGRKISTGWVLIFTRALDPDMLGRMAKSYLLEDLRLTPTNVAALPALPALPAQLPLAAVDGTTLGYLT